MSMVVISVSVRRDPGLGIGTGVTPAQTAVGGPGGGPGGRPGGTEPEVGVGEKSAFHAEGAGLGITMEKLAPRYTEM